MSQNAHKLDLRVTASDGPRMEKTTKHQCREKENNPAQVSNQVAEGKIKVMYTNADVLTNKIDLMKARCQVESPKVVAINEVKPKNQRFKVLPAEFNMEELGFDMFPNNIDEDRGRGQLLFVSKDLKAKRVYFESHFEEVTCVKVDLKNKDKLLIVLIYRSPNSDERNNSYLNKLIDEACKIGTSHLLLLGDFNYKTIDWRSSFSEDKTEMAFLDKVIESGLLYISMLNK